MGLQLIETVNEMTDGELEEFLSVVRVKRLAAVVALQQAEDVKLSAELGKLKTKFEKAREMLTKDIVRLDKVVEKVEERMVAVDSLRHEISHVEEMVEIAEARS